MQMGGSPAYKLSSRGYQDRLIQESKISNLEYAWNCGKGIFQPSFHWGIMGGEFKNKQQNILALCKTSHYMCTALYEISIAKCILNYLTYTMHVKQCKLPKAKRRFPQYPTMKDEYPWVMQKLQNIYNGVSSLLTVEHEFHSDENHVFYLMPNTRIIKILPTLIYDKIISNNITFNKTDEWNERHKYGLHAIIEKYNITQVNDENIQTLIEEFKENGLHQFATKKLLSGKLQNILKNYESRLIIYN